MKIETTGIGAALLLYGLLAAFFANSPPILATDCRQQSTEHIRATTNPEPCVKTDVCPDESGGLLASDEKVLKILKPVSTAVSYLISIFLIAGSIGIFLRMYQLVLWAWIGLLLRLFEGAGLIIVIRILLNCYSMDYLAYGLLFFIPSMVLVVVSFITRHWLKKQLMGA